MPFTERTSEKLHHMLITDEEQQEKVCIVSFCPSSLIENRSPREKCGPRKKRQEQKALFPQPEWQEGAGSLLLLAAADQTELLACLESALSPNLLAANPSLRLAHSKPETLRSQLATLLFLEAVGLRRTWDLRGYTGQTLARLSGRHRVVLQEIKGRQNECEASLLVRFREPLQRVE